MPKQGIQKSKVYTIPAPTGGLNDRDARDAMPPTDALEMIKVDLVEEVAMN